MSEQEWEPFGFTDVERVLRPDLTGGLREALLGWLMVRLVFDGDRRWASIAKCLTVQNECQVSLGVTASSGDSLLDMNVAIAKLRTAELLLLLRVVDYYVSKERGGGSGTVETMLKNGRSKWTIGERGGRNGLVERVPAGVQAVVETAIETSGDAGVLLERAWAHVHDLKPNDTAAYIDAVRAVETASIPVVKPSRPKPTLGNVLGQMEKDGDWQLSLREDSRAPSAEAILLMIRTLWFGHRDRHGSDEYSDVTHEEARVAVTLAAPLVDWFVSGAIQRR